VVVVELAFLRTPIVRSRSLHAHTDPLIAVLRMILLIMLENKLLESTQRFGARPATIKSLTLRLLPRANILLVCIC
jgi:hypothetical protein